MTNFTRSFTQITSHDIALVGGKGANLGEMTKADLPIPPGFCVTTGAYRAFIKPFSAKIYKKLEDLNPADLVQIRTAGEAVRVMMAKHKLPTNVAKAIVKEWKYFGADHAYAVRSSATAEDLPTASFAGQQDTYLNVIGEKELLEQIKNCFISLFTDRAILYRIQNNFPHHSVALSVVVQQMVMPQVSGILFTADPITEHRGICSIDASFGLGEALVSGLVSADLYKIKKENNQILSREIAKKKIAILPLKGGGTQTVDLPRSEQTKPALSDQQIHQLTAIGSKIEYHYGTPQDIEWAIEDDIIYITQSRPITSLFPKPITNENDDSLHAFISLSHFQVMTDPIPPLAISLWKYFPPIGLDLHGEFHSLQSVGSRLYCDVSPLLRHPILGRVFINLMAVADTNAQAAAKEIVTRPDFKAKGNVLKLRKILPKMLPTIAQIPLNIFFKKTSGATQFANKTIAHFVEESKTNIFDNNLKQDEKLSRALKALNNSMPTAGRWAPKLVAGLVSQKLLRSLAGENNTQLVDDIERGLVGNVVTDMNLAIGDLSDLARHSPALSKIISNPKKSVSARLKMAETKKGGGDFVKFWNKFIEQYGSRCASEIDASRARWSEDPAPLMHMVVSMMSQETIGGHRLHYQSLTKNSDAAALELPNRIKGWNAWLKRPLIKRLINVARDMGALREHHKFMMVQILAQLKTVLVQIGNDFEKNKTLKNADDIWFLEMIEVRQILRGDLKLDPHLSELINQRRENFALDAKRKPPRMITNHGEIVRPKITRDGAPKGALIGSPVSAGIYEGVAKVITKPSSQTLKPGEILIAPFTDPGWTPLFVNAAALVTEVGGLMTHGSVVAREYGIPAVVGVPDAMQKISTGDIIRVDGAMGFVEILTKNQKDN